MGLQIPNYRPVLLDESPLEEVVCQLRFPAILKIATEQPVEFQDAVRKHFPVFVEEQGLVFGFEVGGQALPPINEPTWQFRTSDESWIVSLTKNFVALKTTAYQNIDDFVDRLFRVVPIFERIYEPSFYERVGLRYVNRIVVAREEGRRVQWERFLNSHLAGAYADPALRDGVVDAKHYLLLETDHGQLGWRYSCDMGQLDGSPAERYTLDFDHFTLGQIACSNVKERLMSFNDIIYRFFRWCLTEEGFAFLKPRSSSSSIANERSAT